MPSERFTRAHRVRRKGEFQHVFDTGTKVSSRYFTMLAGVHQGPATRLGLVASRRLGDAVHRNRAKRLIREIFRRMNLPAGGLDVVVIPRREIFAAEFTELDREFRSALRRAASRLKTSHAG